MIWGFSLRHHQIDHQEARLDSLMEWAVIKHVTDTTMTYIIMTHPYSFLDILKENQDFDSELLVFI